MVKRDTSPKGIGKRLVAGARDVAARALRSAADKIEGPKASFELADVKMEFQVDIGRRTVWATQAQMADLFGLSVASISRHIANIIEDGELEAEATVTESVTVQIEAGRSVSRTVSHYNLDMIISVGLRAKSPQATVFRQWALKTLRAYVVDGYAINEDRLRNDPEALYSLAERVRTIRAEEKNLYRQVRDCFSLTSSDYDKNSPAAKRFFQTLQEKFTYAASAHTSAELILARADASKENMGLSTFEGPFPTKKDVTVGKNYLEAQEMRYLKLVADSFLIFVEAKALKLKSVTMEELLVKLDKILEFHDMPVFAGYTGGYQRAAADKHAERQLHLFNSRTDQEKLQASRVAALPTPTGLQDIFA